MPLMNIFDVHVVDKIWDFVPLDDISIRVMHRSHDVQLEEGEYIYGSCRHNSRISKAETT